MRRFRWRRAAGLCLRGFLVIVLALCLCEGWFRVRSYLRIADVDLPIRAVMSRRLLQIWAPTMTNSTFGGFFLRNKEEILMPPFSTFVNRGETDPDRLAHVFRYSILPPSRRFEARDFLVSDDRRARSTYTATSNALGFRDPERTVDKPPGTFRIVCLGSYTTFGHAVSDEATFARELERILNERHGPARRFEVWNGGIHSATAIMGLARVEGDVLKYAPDLVLLDYGLVDLSLVHDFVAPGDHALRGVPPYENFYRGSRSLFWSEVVLPYVLASPFGGSFLGIKLLDRLGDSDEDDTESTMGTFVRVMGRMVSVLHEHGVRVALLNQVSFPAVKFFEKVAPEIGAPHFNVYDLLAPPTAEEIRAFDSADTWANEFSSMRDRLATKPQYSKIRPYMADIYQLNALGHRRLAEGLARALEKGFLDVQPGPP